MLVTLKKLVTKLIVYPENMRKNMELTGGLYASQAALLMLTEKGMERKDAYEAVQRAAMKTWKHRDGLPKNLAEEPEVSSRLSVQEIEKACSPERHFHHVEEKLRAIGIG